MAKKMEDPSTISTFPPLVEDYGSAESVVQAVHALTTVLAAENGKKKIWIEKNPTLSIAVMGVAFSLLSFAGQGYFQNQVAQGMDPFVKQTDARLQGVEGDAREDRETNVESHKLLRQNDADLAVYMLEGDRYDRALLEEVARKLRVEIKERPAALGEAEKRVRAVRDAARIENMKENE